LGEKNIKILKKKFTLWLAVAEEVWILSSDGHIPESLHPIKKKIKTPNHYFRKVMTKDE